MTFTRSLSLISLAVAASLALLLGSCRGAKGAVDTSVPATVGSDEPAYINKPSDVSPDKLFDAMCGSYGQWTDFSAPVKITLRQPRSLNVSGRLTMVRDREIQISLRVFGMEVGGLYADTDSIYVFEKLNRSMMAASMARLTEATGLTLGDLQELLLGRCCYPGRGTLDASASKLFNISADPDGIYIIEPRQKRAGGDWAYSAVVVDGIRPEMVLGAVAVTVGQAEGACSYASPLLTPAGPASPKAEILASLSGKKLEAAMDINLLKADWNTGRTPSGRIPQGYDRISLEALTKMLKR